MPLSLRYPKLCPPPQNSNTHNRHTEMGKRSRATTSQFSIRTSLCANSRELASVSRLRVLPSGKCKNMYGTPEGPADTESLAKDARDFLTRSLSSYGCGKNRK